MAEYPAHSQIARRRPFLPDLETVLDEDMTGEERQEQLHDWTAMSAREERDPQSEVCQGSLCHGMAMGPAGQLYPALTSRSPPNSPPYKSRQRVVSPERHPVMDEVEVD
jgi:hypothetical protein